jgi:hypothetical protein
MLVIAKFLSRLTHEWPGKPHLPHLMKIINSVFFSYLFHHPPLLNNNTPFSLFSHFSLKFLVGLYSLFYCFSLKLKYWCLFLLSSQTSFYFSQLNFILLPKQTLHCWSFFIVVPLFQFYQISKSQLISFNYSMQGIRIAIAWTNCIKVVDEQRVMSDSA